MFYVAVLCILSSFCLLYLVDAVIGTPNALNGLKFLKENKAREGVITRKSGLQYKVLRAGNGTFHPHKDARCDCHYIGTSNDLTPDAHSKPDAEWMAFNNTFSSGKPEAFVPSQSKPGVREALGLMVEGDYWELYIHPDLGFGDRGLGDLLHGGDTLIYRIELLKIKGTKVRATTCDPQSRKHCEWDEIRLLDDLGQVPTVEAIVRKEKEVQQKLDEPLKAGEKEHLKGVLRMLKQAKKVRKHGDEL